MDEEKLDGGRTFGAVRIGDEVHRPVQQWTATVHALLNYLQERDFAGAPRVIGFDGAGREVLTYLPGVDARRHQPVARVAALRRRAHTGRRLAAEPA